MSDFEVDLGDGRSIVVDAPNAQEAAGAAKKFLASERGRGDARNKSDALAQAVGQGATFGFGDEATAAVRAAAPGFSNWMMSGPALQRDESIGGSNPPPQTVSTAPTFQGRYDEELARERAKAQQFRKDSPALSIGGNIAGGLASTGAAAVAGVPLAFGAAPSLGGNMVRVGAVGAGLGGVQGFGEGEGGFENRVMKGALPGAAFGGAVGAAMPVAGAVGRAAIESAPGQWVSRNVVGPVAQRLARVLEGPAPVRSLSAAAPDGTPGPMGPMTEFAQSVSDPARTGAIERLTTALQRSGMTRDQAERRLAQLGPEAVLADLDPQLLSQARMANTMPGETRTWGKNVLESRDRQAGNRLVSAFEGDAPPPSTFALQQGMDANRSAVGADVYGKMRGEKLNISGDMQKLAEVPAVKEAIAAIQQDAASTGKQLTAIEIAHRVKQKLNDVAEAAFASGKPINKADLRSLADSWESAFWNANPTAREADAAYRNAASLPDFAAAGRNFLRKGSTDAATESSAPALADLLAGANPQQVTAARAGATNAARETALEGNRLARALAQRVDESAPVRDKLTELYGSQQGGKIMQQASNERTFAETSNEILRGSKTADKLAEIFDNAGAKISSSGVQPRLWERFIDLAAKITAPNESVRNQIGRMALTSDPERNAEILRLAFEALRKRQAGSPVAAALAGRAGSSLSSPGAQ